jgi:hypothetical protein
MGQELKQRVEYLVNDLEAYQDYDYGNKGLHYAVKHELYMWKKQQKDMTVVQVPQLYSKLWKQARCKSRGQQFKEALDGDWKAFPTYNSGSTHLRIEDKYEHLLVYRLPIPTQYTETLVVTENLILSSGSKEHRRGQTSEEY